MFAFAVTLLVVSLEVPHTFDELTEAMRGFFAFALCFAMLVQVWYHHYLFSRRYGLQTPYAVVLNALLLFVVLFYVYPLKFLFALLVSEAGGRHGAFAIEPHQVPRLMVIYSLGFTAVFGLFAFMYRYAERMGEALDLDPYERLRTRQALVDHAAYAILGVVVAVTATALPPARCGNAGFLFFLIGPYHFVSGSLFGRRVRALGGFA